MEHTLSRLRVTWLQLKPLLRFSPHSGHLWLDVILLLLVGALHHTVLPSLTRANVPIDLMTPWLVTMLVLETLPRGLFLTVLGAMILETHSAAPAGLYLCSYWMIAVAIHLTRGTLSWRHALPWVITFAASQLWVIGFETFVLAVNAENDPFDLAYFGIQALRLVLGVGIGMLLSYRFLATGLQAEES